MEGAHMEWTKDLAVGIDIIDIQHQELFRRINNLVIAIKEHRCKSEIDGTIKFLEEYANFHFAEEERRMKESSYEGLEEHRRYHAVYLRALAEVKEQAALPRIQGATYELSVTVNQIVVDWIIDHIMKIDRKFGEFMRSSKR